MYVVPVCAILASFVLGRALEPSGLCTAGVDDSGFISNWARIPPVHRSDPPRSTRAGDVLSAWQRDVLRGLMPLSSNSVSATEPPLSDSSRILFWLKEMRFLGSEAGAFEMQAEALAMTALREAPVAAGSMS